MFTRRAEAQIVQAIVAMNAIDVMYELRPTKRSPNRLGHNGAMIGLRDVSLKLGTFNECAATCPSARAVAPKFTNSA